MLHPEVLDDDDDVILIEDDDDVIVISDDEPEDAGPNLSSKPQPRAFRNSQYSFASPTKSLNPTLSYGLSKYVDEVIVPDDDSVTAPRFSQPQPSTLKQVNSRTLGKREKGFTAKTGIIAVDEDNDVITISDEDEVTQPNWSTWQNLPQSQLNHFNDALPGHLAKSIQVNTRTLGAREKGFTAKTGIIAVDDDNDVITISDEDEVTQPNWSTWQNLPQSQLNYLNDALPGYLTTSTPFLTPPPTPLTAYNDVIDIHEEENTMNTTLCPSPAPQKQASSRTPTSSTKRPTSKIANKNFNVAVQNTDITEITDSEDDHDNVTMTNDEDPPMYILDDEDEVRSRPQQYPQTVPVTRAELPLKKNKGRTSDDVREEIMQINLKSNNPSPTSSKRSYRPDRLDQNINLSSSLTEEESCYLLPLTTQTQTTSDKTSQNLNPTSKLSTSISPHSYKLKHFPEQESSAKDISKTSDISPLLEETSQFIPLPTTKSKSSTKRNSSNSNPAVNTASLTELSSVFDDDNISFWEDFQKVAAELPPTLTNIKGYKSTLDLSSNYSSKGKQKVMPEKIYEYPNTPKSMPSSANSKPNMYKKFTLSPKFSTTDPLTKKLAQVRSSYDNSITIKKSVTPVGQSLSRSASSLNDSSSISSSTSWLDIFFAIIVSLLILIVFQYVNSNLTKSEVYLIK